jgi:protein-S-isoprenylcysteine O-methyltransferase Ste14
VKAVDGAPPGRAPILAKVPPPAQFALTFLVGVGLDRLMPWRPAEMALASVHWAGFALAVAGCSLAAAAAGRFVLRRTTLDPTGEPSRLVVSGAHGWSRNPMYLSLTVVYAGLTLVLGRAWPLALVVLPWASMNRIVIPYEEARLRAIFGGEYGDYCGRVRRWI